MSRERSRRQFLREAAATAAAGAAWAVGLGRTPAWTRKQTVAILGGGVAGLSAAHELIVRGLDVNVYERKALGGKARSIAVPGSAPAGHAELPGEHGFRFFPGFYHNLGDTMRRIPFGEGSTTHANLVDATAYRQSREGRADNYAPLAVLAGRVPRGTPQQAIESVVAAIADTTSLGPGEREYFLSKLWVYLTSHDERRLGQWEFLSWSDFIRSKEMSEEYRRQFDKGLIRNLAAMRGEDASSHSIGYIGEASAMSLMGRGNEPGASFDRVLNGSTSEAWLDPWISYLRKRGVRFFEPWTVGSLRMRGKRITSARARDAAGRVHEIHADWFIVAMPVERAVRLLSADILAADPRLEGIKRLRTDWMNGVMFYLRREVPLVHGHVNYNDSPWALTSISQAQFWKRDFRTYGDGSVRECLSTIISDWVTPGILFRKTARRCTPPQIAKEVWAQVKAHVNDQGEQVLTDNMLHLWFIDPAIIASGTRAVRNDEPLLIQNFGSWDDRPDSATKIPNLFLAGDWVRTNINVTTMEGANEGARQAVNALLDAAHSNKPRAMLKELYRPPEYEVFKQIDRDRYRAGLPNVFDPDQRAP